MASWVSVRMVTASSCPPLVAVGTARSITWDLGALIGHVRIEPPSSPAILASIRTTFTGLETNIAASGLMFVMCVPCRIRVVPSFQAICGRFIFVRGKLR